MEILVKEEKTMRNRNEKEAVAPIVAPEPPKQPEKEVQIVTMEQLLLNNMSVMLQRQEQTIQVILEGFKKLGVKFEEPKAE